MIDKQRFLRRPLSRLYSFILKLEAPDSSEAFVNIYQTTLLNVHKYCFTRKDLFQNRVLRGVFGPEGDEIDGGKGRSA
jgi:hypothetical protein